MTFLDILKAKTIDITSTDDFIICVGDTCQYANGVKNFVANRLFDMENYREGSIGKTRVVLTEKSSFIRTLGLNYPEQVLNLYK